LYQHTYAGECVCDNDKAEVMDGGDCKAISDVIEHCNQVDSTGKCSRCDLYYHLEGEDCVKNEDKHCLARYERTDGTYYCSACEPGYGYSYSSEKCKKCKTKDCESCSFDSFSGAETCSVCSNGKQFDEKTKCTADCDTGCVACIEFVTSIADQREYGNCAECEEGYAMLISNSIWSYGDTIGKCVSIEHCVIASTETTCETCEDGYMYVYGGKCVEKIENCYTQSYSDGKCTTCIGGYYPNADGSECVQCDEHCNYCDSTTTCWSDSYCDDGYYLDDNDKCSECSAENCRRCSLDICDTCEVGYGLKAGYVDGEYTTTCKECTPEHAGTCSFTDSTDDDGNPIEVETLVSCEAGYTTNDDNSGCIPCGTHCTVCSTSDVNICSSCEEGYYWVDDCTTCVTGFAMNGEGECVPDYVENCYQSETEDLQCDGCYLGYAVDEEGQCTACDDENCLSCDHTGAKCYVCVNDANDIKSSERLADVIGLKARGFDIYYSVNGECKKLQAGSAVSVMIAMILIALLF